ncbi:hypothetical protein GMORB2_3859 [Geosmithia morbida]|uniref:Uncharacterized protein n=1 Tax=Geosmithia morbida TaxID=1094350 RepID=A0A9P4YZP4_9HYPO|nr:uncharacterized protein GMORB2_3859 [Geosmithia morbida]KAF4125020.1 hypothetical protein GMORB2_3859 [Geosmithia morbida]
MASRRRSNRNMPENVSGSWRMVEGDNESFDTSVVPAPQDDDDDHAADEGPHQGAFEPSTHQSFSGARHLPAHDSSSSRYGSQDSDDKSKAISSQDSIRDFSRHQDDPENILRSPFRPSMPGVEKSDGPELRMPILGSDGRGGDSVRRNPRRRCTTKTESSTAGASGGRASSRTRGHRHRSPDLNSQPRFEVLGLAPAALMNLLLWAANVARLALVYAQMPVAILLAVWITLGSLIMVENMVKQSIKTSMSPLCLLPGAVSVLHLPFCPSSDPHQPPADDEPRMVEFDDLMGVQGKLEQVLETSADGVSLPYEMKRSETAIRDLRTLVRASNLQSREELVQEFGSYIDVSRRAAADLQRFNTHCGATVDSVIAINRWTLRYLDTLAPANDPVSTDLGFMTRWSNWVWSPFLPENPYYNDFMILNKYVEHAAHVSDRITTLILEAQTVLALLSRAEDHLGLIHELSSRDASAVADRREDTLSLLWSMVGGNRARLHNLSQQMALLRRVSIQRSDAMRRVQSLILELEAIQAGLEDLRDRVAAPELTLYAFNTMPLSVHIETIDRGIQRLEDARARITAAETDRVRDALSRVGIVSEPWLEGR